MNKLQAYQAAWDAHAENGRSGRSTDAAWRASWRALQAAHAALRAAQALAPEER